MDIGSIPVSASINEVTSTATGHGFGSARACLSCNRTARFHAYCPSERSADGIALPGALIEMMERRQVAALASPLLLRHTETACRGLASRIAYPCRRDDRARKGDPVNVEMTAGRSSATVEPGSRLLIGLRNGDAEVSVAVQQAIKFALCDAQLAGRPAT